MNFSVKSVLKRRHNYLIPFLFIFCARCIYKSSYTPPSHPNIQTRRSDCKSLWKSDRIGQKICVHLWNLWDIDVLKTGNTLAISDISLIFAPCKVLNIRIMRTFNYNEMPHEVLEMASEYAIKESRSGRGLSHSQAMEKIKEQRGWRNH